MKQTQAINKASWPERLPPGPMRQRLTAELELLEGAFSFELELRAILGRHVRDHRLVDDLLQRTYAYLLETCTAQPVPPHRIRARLFGAASAALRGIVPQNAFDTEDSHSANAPSPVHEDALILSIVSRMPRKMRQVVTLWKIYGQAPSEIARRLRISEKDVLQRAALAARRLSQGLGRGRLLTPLQWLRQQFRSVGR